MADDFLRCFETGFPGARAAFNGKAYYAWSSGHMEGALRGGYRCAGEITGGLH